MRTKIAVGCDEIYTFRSAHMIRLNTARLFQRQARGAFDLHHRLGRSPARLKLHVEGVGKGQTSDVRTVQQRLDLTQLDEFEPSTQQDRLAALREVRVGVDQHFAHLVEESAVVTLATFDVLREFLLLDKSTFRTVQSAVRIRFLDKVLKKSIQGNGLFI